ncbi:MAG TPA: iron-sulfur cluster assembly scaffold protein [Fimbriimonadaceae bacterium]|nr:iron-sulfur cluster assembly scaffold protein [Fimbriimonadaceae bacterium]
MFSAIATDHIQRPRNQGPLGGEALVGKFGNRGDGPYMTLWLVIEGNKIANAAYQTYGCPAAVACASMTCEIVRGRTVAQAESLEAEDLIVVLGGLPEGKEECARMAVAALKNALDGQGEA